MKAGSWGSIWSCSSSSSCSCPSPGMTATYYNIVTLCYYYVLPHSLLGIRCKCITFNLKEKKNPKENLITYSHYLICALLMSWTWRWRWRWRWRWSHNSCIPWPLPVQRPCNRQIRIAYCTGNKTDINTIYQ